MDGHRFARITGLAALLVIALPEASGRFASASGTPFWSATAWRLLFAAWLVGFSLAYWRITRRGDPGDPRDPAPSRGRAMVLLAAQVLIATCTSLELLVVVAAELPLVLAPRDARAWLIVVLGTTTAVFALLGAGVLINTDQPYGAADGSRLWLDWIGSLVWQAFAFGMGALASSEARQHTALQAAHAELAAAQEQLADRSRLAERLAIARELHDSVGHHLTAISVQLEVARQLTDGRAADIVSRAGAMTRRALDDVRHAVDPLRRPRLSDLRAGLEELARLAARPSVSLDIDRALPPLGISASHALYRCAQEALTNAMRHSRASTLTLSLRPHAGGILLQACDDGEGRETVAPGHGLTGMRERLLAFGGRLEIETAPGRGFRLSAWMPVDALQDPA